MVHCAATPVLLAVLPTAAGFLGAWHPVLLAGAAGTAAWAFVPGYRLHRKLQVPLLAVFGLTLLGVGTLAFHENFAAETALTASGATLMLLAHWRNRKLSHAQCKHH